MTNEQSGPISQTPFAFYDPASSCWRTSQASFDLGLAESSATLPNSGSMRSGRLYARLISERATDGNGSSLLPAPGAADGTGGKTHRLGSISPTGMKADGTKVQVSLQDALNLLPTPVAHDTGRTPQQYLARMAKQDSGSTRISSMAVLVQHLLPTPLALDQSGGGHQHGDGGMDLRTAVSSLGDLMDQLSSVTSRPSGDQLPGL